MHSRWFSGVQGLTCASLGSPLRLRRALRSCPPCAFRFAALAMSSAADPPNDAGAAPREPTGDRSARRGPVPLPAALRRDHCVSVRLNASELAQLDGQRGRFQRGEWLRMAALDQLPPTVPEVNAQAWAHLARLAANLNQAQAAINVGHASHHDLALFEDLVRAVVDLRRTLVGVRP